MSIYVLTSIGESYASNPTPNLTDGMRVLYFLRRHHGKAGDDQIKAFSGVPENTISSTLGELVKKHAVQKIG